MFRVASKLFGRVLGSRQAIRWLAPYEVREARGLAYQRRVVRPKVKAIEEKTPQLGVEIRVPTRPVSVPHRMRNVYGPAQILVRKAERRASSKAAEAYIGKKKK
jgi:hypothetical protein